METHFYKHYQANLDKILTARDTLSGTHPINPEAADQWILSQHNPQRRSAAQSLIANTHYVTLRQLFTQIQAVITNIYSHHSNPQELRLFLSRPKQSPYFVSVLAVYFIKILGYPAPKIVNTHKDLVNASILIVDDMAYTGGQMVGTYNNVSQHARELIIGLAYCSESAFQRLSRLPVTLAIGTKIPDLRTTIGDRRFLEILYYFSPYTLGATRVSVYFDHKIADPVSTFTNALMFGPVLPCKLEYNDTELLAQSLLGIIETQQNDPGDELKQVDEVVAVLPLLEAVIEDDVCESGRRKLSFIPFITGCRPPDMENVSYNEFISDTVAGARCIQPFYKIGSYAMI